MSELSDRVGVGARPDMLSVGQRVRVDWPESRHHNAEGSVVSSSALSTQVRLNRGGEPLRLLNIYLKAVR